MAFRKNILLLLIIGSFLMAACNTSRIVKPLKAKETAIGLDFGGPIIDFAGAKIPIPLSSISVGHGVDSTFTLFGGLHITSLVFGTVQVDAGMVKEVLHPRGAIPGISIAPIANVMVDGFEGNFRIYPQVDVNLYWQYLPKHEHYFYITWGSWFDLWKLAHNAPKPSLYYPTFALGHTFENKKMRYTLEAKYLAPNIDNQGGPVQYNGSDGRGSWGVYISIFRKF